MPLLIWEEIPHDNGFYLRRTPIFGGWLVSMISDVITANENYASPQGNEWRSSITFVPDPDHAWEL